jgi:tetratricopeptide (TPR) repeat protein
VRAKGILLGADPVRGSEAVRLLADAARAAPPTAGQSFHLARLHLRQGRLDLAEATLREAVRNAPLPEPELLALLVQVQVNAESVAAARQTADRLKQLDPKNPVTAVAEARVLVAEEKRSDATTRLVAAAGSADPNAAAAFAGPLLEEMGCPAEAEGVYRRMTGPAAPLKLAGFFLRQKRPDDVVRTLLPGDPKTPAGPAARLLAGAVRLRPPALLPEPERSNWQKVVGEVTAWVRARLEAAPADPQLLAATAALEPVVGKPDAVVPAFQRALEAAPDDPAAKANLAFARAVYARDGSDAALALVQAAIDKAGPSPSLLDTRAVVHLAGGRADPAAADLLAAIELERKTVYVFHLAQAYDLLAGRQPENGRRRDELLAEAVRRGLGKADLDPREWAEFDRLTGTDPAAGKTAGR